MRSAPGRKQPGFTLVELLVVIAVIAILAAILFPVFARARENARRSSCLSNLKQLGLGMMQYSQDYDEKLPLGLVGFWYPSVGSTFYDTGAGWGGQIYPYVKSTQVFVCPSDTTKANSTGGPVSYAYNMLICFPISTSFIRASIPAFAATSRTVMLFEARGANAPVSVTEENRAGGNSRFSPTGYGNDCQLIQNPADAVNSTGRPVKFATGYMDMTSAERNGSCNQYSDGAAGRHLETSNFLMVDGHVKSMRGMDVSASGAGESAATTTHQVTFNPL